TPVLFCSGRRRHTISARDWSSDVCSSDLGLVYSDLLSIVSVDYRQSKNTGWPGLTIIDTDYGEKIGIDQSTCVSDTYCTKIMACPSFEKVIVTRNKPPRPRVRKISLDDIPPPVQHRFTDTWSAFVSGIGGMGVGVLSSTLARAGTKEGYTVKFNDKKGLAIRNGAVYAQNNYAKERATT